MQLLATMKRSAFAVMIAMMTVTGVCAEDAINDDGRVAIGMRMVSDEQRTERRAFQYGAESESERSTMGQELAVERETMDYGTDWGRVAWPYATHAVLSVGIYGEMVEIEDGSTFTVASGSRWTVQGWRAGDYVHLLPNHGYLFGLIHSSYAYCLYNESTGESVEVNLTLGPYQFAETSWWISAIDDYNGIVWLMDGTVLKVDASDRYLIQQWEPNDHIIMGYNDGWHSGSYPNIILNVATVDHVRVHVVGAY